LSARRTDVFGIGRGHPEPEPRCVDVTDALFHGVLVARPDPEPPGWAWRSSSSKPRRTDGKWSTRPTWSHSSAPTPFVNGKLVERPDERRQWAAA
jgi:hypothetical protein